MPPRKRLLVALALAAVVAAPAAVLAGICAGNACLRVAPAEGRVPFCSLPEELRRRISDGFRDGRSPHILALAGEETISHPAGTWPSLQDRVPDRVPLAFAGPTLDPGAGVPDGTTLDALAPTLAEMIDLNRGHPGVRSGVAVEGIDSSRVPRLVVLVVWKGIGSSDLERRPDGWPALRRLMQEGAATLEAYAGALPADDTATLTTIGTGALPKDHGITGSLVRNDQGAVVEPWGPRAPFSVVATLGDDLDEIEDQEPMIGFIGTPTDLGLTGGNWYVEHDRDDVIFARLPYSQATAAERLLSSGYGSDEIPDLLAVAMTGRVRDMDAATSRILSAAERVAGDEFVVAATSTGSEAARSRGFPVSEVEAHVEATLGVDALDATTPGGFFIDQEAMTEAGLSDDRVVSALRSVKDADGDPLFADVFPAIAVTFARYC